MSIQVISNPLLVISYNDDIRKSLMENLERCNANGVPCGSFLEAEDIAREGIYNGILVDLQSIVKAKGDEKTIACSLTGFYPTLRVRALGSMVVPMAMPGDARQDGSLNDFMNKSCAAFTPRRLRMFRRREIGFSALLGDVSRTDRAFMVNLSWGGGFISHTSPEKFDVGSEVRLNLPDLGLDIPVSVRWVRPWGQRQIPGIGVRFIDVDGNLENVLASVIKSQINNDRDRMIAR